MGKLVAEENVTGESYGNISMSQGLFDDKNWDCAEMLKNMNSIWHLKQLVQDSAAYEPKMTNLLNVTLKDASKVSPVRRNQSAYNLKCLTAFYSLPPEVFCLALSTLDRFITKVKVQPKYLSCITTTCFYHAAKNVQKPCTLDLEKLIKVSQCDCRSGDIVRMETIILDKLRPLPGLDVVTALTLLQAVVTVYSDISHMDISNHMNKLVSKLLMCLCHAELLDSSLVMIASAVLCAHLQQLGMEYIQSPAFEVILNLCQINDREFIIYQEKIAQFLHENYEAPSSLPKLQLKWDISNRTRSRLRPGYYGDTGLPVIHETPYDCADFRSSGLEDFEGMVDDDSEDDDDIPGTPTADDFNSDFSFPNSPSESSPISSGLPQCHLLTYADVVCGRLYREC